MARVERRGLTPTILGKPSRLVRSLFRSTHVPNVADRLMFEQIFLHTPRMHYATHAALGTSLGNGDLFDRVE